MWWVKQKSRAISCNESGSISLLFALASIPALGILGASLDYSRASNIRSVLQSGADSAALAAANGADLPWSKRQDLAKEVFRSHVKTSPEIKSWNIITRNVDGAIRVDASGGVAASMARILGIKEITTNVVAEVKAGASGSLEVALVLDTTGSMRADMDALRSAAKDLTDKIMGGGAKVAVVPYVAAVNPGRDKLPSAMLDMSADSKFHAIALENKRTFMRNGCDPQWGPPTGGGPTGEGGSWLRRQWQGQRSFLT